MKTWMVVTIGILVMIGTGFKLSQEPEGGGSIIISTVDGELITENFVGHLEIFINGESFYSWEPLPVVEEKE